MGELASRGRWRRWPLPRVAMVAATAATVLAACATRTPPKPYVAPQGPDTARLLSRGAMPADGIYGVFVHGDAVACVDPRLVTVGGAGKSPQPSTVAAGRPATVDFLTTHRSSNQSCRVRWTFTPVAGRTYLVAGSLSPTGCSARVLDATDPDDIRPVAGAQRRDRNGASCSALSANAGSVDSRTSETGEAVLNPGASTDDIKGLINP